MSQHHQYRKFVGVFAILVMVPFCSQVNSLKYNSCDKETPSSEVLEVKVNNCESTVDSCVFIRDSNKTIDLEFKPNRDIKEVKVKVAGKLKTLPVPFKISPEQACGNYGFDCPLKAGETYKFHLSMPILRTYPKINVDVILKLLDESNSPIVCVEIPAIIREPQKE